MNAGYIEKADALEPDDGVDFLQASHHRFVVVSGENRHVKKVVLLNDLEIIVAF